jgi:hypothetical protein
MSIYWPYEVFVGSDVLAFSFTLPESLVAVFIESDRIPSLPQEEQDDDYSPEYRYEATVKTIRDRLEIIGYTSDRWRAELELFRQVQMEEIQEQIVEAEDRGQSASKSKRIAKVIEHSLPERWINTLTAMLSDGWGWCPREGRSFVLAKAMTDGEYGPIQLPFTDERCLFRALVDLHDDTDLVHFDFGDAVWNENADPKACFTVQAVSALLDEARTVEKIIVLTEGKTDTRILERSFARLYPHLTHMYAFLDHDAFSTGGGTDVLDRLARGFAGAGISNRIVVLFDNDTAGFAAAQRLMDTPLPANFKILTLPELEIAKTYPTLGPTGAALANINGSACSIELYCGPTALTGVDGNLSPIQWTSYDRKLKRYQGEPMGKDKIQERFFEVLDRSSDPVNDVELASIKQVLQSIMRIGW